VILVVKVEDIGVIYYTKLANGRIYLLTIFSKTQKENIDITSLKPIVDKIELEDFKD